VKYGEIFISTVKAYIRLIRRGEGSYMQKKKVEIEFRGRGGHSVPGKGIKSNLKFRKVIGYTHKETENVRRRRRGEKSVEL